MEPWIIRDRDSVRKDVNPRRRRVVETGKVKHGFITESNDKSLDNTPVPKPPKMPSKLAGCVFQYSIISSRLGTGVGEESISMAKQII